MLSVVIPAYNESRRILPTLERIRAHLDAAGEEYEVIVVDDGSTDATAEVVEGVVESWPRLSLERLGANLGKGAAVRRGMLRARGDLRLFSDADLSTPIEELERLRARLGGRCTVAIGSRGLDRSLIEVRQKWWRELMGRINNLILRTIMPLRLRDTQCGFKLFTAEAAIACFEPLGIHRFGFDVEVLLRATRRGWEVAEVPVRWRHVDESRVHPLRDSAAVLRDVIRLRLRLRRL